MAADGVLTSYEFRQIDEFWVMIMFEHYQQIGWSTIQRDYFVVPSWLGFISCAEK